MLILVLTSALSPNKQTDMLYRAKREPGSVCFYRVHPYICQVRGVVLGVVVCGVVLVVSCVVSCCFCCVFVWVTCLPYHPLYRSSPFRWPFNGHLPRGNGAHMRGYSEFNNLLVRFLRTHTALAEHRA